MYLLIDPREERVIWVAIWNGKGTPRFFTYHRNHTSLLECITKHLPATSYKLQAILLVPGPGGFSTVRTAVTLANTMAFALGIPVVAVKPKKGEAPVTAFRRALNRAGRAKAGVFVEPVYGKEPNIKY